jgi:hypothetical protein
LARPLDALEAQAIRQLKTRGILSGRPIVTTRPAIFELTDKGIMYLEPSKDAKAASLKEAVAAARGATEPPKDSVRFG